MHNSYLFDRVTVRGRLGEQATNKTWLDLALLYYYSKLVWLSGYSASSVHFIFLIFKRSRSNWFLLPFQSKKRRRKSLCIIKTDFAFKDRFAPLNVAKNRKIKQIQNAILLPRLRKNIFKSLNVNARISTLLEIGAPLRISLSLHRRSKYFIRALFILNDRLLDLRLPHLQRPQLNTVKKHGHPTRR